MPEWVRITDVSPRDGLQNEPGIVPVQEKARLIGLLCETGVDEIEVTSFVSPRWVPQLGDARQVLQEIYFDRDKALAMAGIEPLPSEAEVRSRIGRSPMLSALVPNSKGMDEFVAAGAFEGRFLLEKAGVFTAASESFCRRNTNASIAETLERFAPVVERSHSLRILVRGYISCAIACPFEGAIAPDTVADVAQRLAALGVDEIDLGDTIGAGTPESVSRMLNAVRDRLGSDWWTRDRMTLHLHDTFGRAADCVRAALELGVRSFDGSVAGLGGCPYASTPGHRAPGNIATETLVRTVHAAGCQTGVDLNSLAVAADFARSIVAKSRAAAAKSGPDA